MDAETVASSPLEALANAPPVEKRGRGRPPGSGKKPDPVAVPAAPEKPAEEGEEDDFNWDELTEAEAADVIASAVDLAFRTTGLPPLKDAEVYPIRKHAKPVLKRWMGVFFKKYMHEILIIGALWGPIVERVEEKRRLANIQPPQNQQPEPPHAT